MITVFETNVPILAKMHLMTVILSEHKNAQSVFLSFQRDAEKTSIRGFKRLIVFEFIRPLKMYLAAAHCDIFL